MNNLLIELNLQLLNTKNVWKIIININVCNNHSKESWKFDMTHVFVKVLFETLIATTVSVLPMTVFIKEQSTQKIVSYNAWVINNPNKGFNSFLFVFLCKICCNINHALCKRIVIMYLYWMKILIQMSWIVDTSQPELLIRENKNNIEIS